MTDYEYVQSLLDTIEKLSEIIKYQNSILEMNGIDLFKKG